MHTIQVPSSVKVVNQTTPKPVNQISKLIIGIVTFFKGPTGPETTHGTKKYLAGEGYGFARVDGVDHFFHSRNCYKFSPKANPKDKLKLIANCAGYSDEIDHYVPPLKVGTRIIVITSGNGEKGKAIFKFALESQLDGIKEIISNAPQYREVSLVYLNGKISGKDKPPVVLWEGNNPAEVIRRFGHTKPTSLDLGNSTVRTVSQLETKLPKEEDWSVIQPYEVRYL